MNKIEECLNITRKETVDKNFKVRYSLDELCRKIFLQECRLTSLNHNLSWIEHLSLISSNSFKPEWKWSGTIEINPKPIKEPLWFRLMMWWLPKKLHILCVLWRFVGHKNCPEHGFHAQSWLTGKCKRCESENM